MEVRLKNHIIYFYTYMHHQTSKNKKFFKIRTNDLKNTTIICSISSYKHTDTSRFDLPFSI